mmetsp:Transcript_35104/g.69266  ORF Transcript_35104/g.69266 Transcript_35104/m.69266 type:complete len:217 (-) Transcript_35104:184-834(-)
MGLFVVASQAGPPVGIYRLCRCRHTGRPFVVGLNRLLDVSTEAKESMDGDEGRGARGLLSNFRSVYLSFFGRQARARPDPEAGLDQRLREETASLMLAPFPSQRPTAALIRGDLPVLGHHVRPGFGTAETAGTEASAASGQAANRDQQSDPDRPQPWSEWRRRLQNVTLAGLAVTAVPLGEGGMGPFVLRVYVLTSDALLFCFDCREPEVPVDLHP